MKPGTVSVWREYSFRCARCPDYEHVHEQWARRADKGARRAYTEARLRGWRKKAKEGWVCPSCLRAEHLENAARKEGD